MYTLGINSVFHDSAACIVHDGKLLAAAEEERFTHIKHGKRPIPFSTYELPYHAINFCLSKAGLHISDIDYFAYSFNPNLLRLDFSKGLQLPVKPTVHDDWNHLFYTSIQHAPHHLTDGFPHHLQQRFEGGVIDERHWCYVDHHLAHAASAFFPSPYKKAAVLTIDGRGEKTTTSYYMGEGTELEPIGEVCLPHSLGLLYEKVTTHLGFLHSSDEYKVMALASFGKPTFLDIFRSAIKIEDGGKYTIDDFDFDKTFGPARKRNDSIEQVHYDIAHSLQKALEEKVLVLADWLYAETQTRNLCLAGGVALNCVLNAVLRDKGPFKNIWIQPAAGDAGTALGAALWTDSRNRPGRNRPFQMNHAYWGPEFTEEEIEKFLTWTKVPFKKMKNVAKETAQLLKDEKVIGWFQGPMEFGPRALGARSILASPLNASMQAKLNEIKDREDFRPVAPVVLEEEAANWFENATPSPFMLFVFDVKNAMAEKIPAVTHVDGTARIQTINENQHPLYYQLLKEFFALTGVPVLINTSFNTRGEPIVCTPRDAIECFWTSPFDALVIHSFLLEK